MNTLIGGRVAAVALVSLLGSIGVVGCDDGEGTASGLCAIASTESCDTPCGSAGVKTCSAAGDFGPCVAPAETCNGLDDNCDGLVDNGLSCGGPVACTPGAVQVCPTTCGTQGSQTCSGDGTFGACTPPPELCDGVDQDCNGQTDDGLTQACTTACGSGTESCVAGKWEACTAKAPQPEICDGLDNDCDGKIDALANGTPLEVDCSNGCGSGSQVCTNKVLGECTAPAPQTEICDGMDNDCNGQTDEVQGGCQCQDGQTMPCGKDTGECSMGVITCVTGKWSECGGENFNAETAESCDGLDNDCDGATDEGDLGGGQSCGTEGPGVCAVGTIQCIQGELACVGGGDPGPELCDGLDNDCNGLTDDDPQGDEYEPNATCGTGTELPEVTEGKGAKTYVATLFDGGDTDWYYLTAAEASGFCLGGDEGPFQLKVTLKPPAGLDYDLCVYPIDTKSCTDLSTDGLCDGSGQDPDLEIWEEGDTPETFFSEQWTGKCFKDDDRDFVIKVVTFDPDTDFSCDPYTLTAEVLTP